MDPSKTKRQASPVAAALPEELVEEVLLRFPADDPASLVHAALVSKRWCRLVCGCGFRRRFRQFHGNNPPLLGLFVRQRRPTVLERFVFVPSSSFRPRHHADRHDLRAVHSCHGRVLLHSTPFWRDSDEVLADLFLWDPIIDRLRKLPRWQLHLDASTVEGNGDAAVLCAELGDGCDHLDCHHGPFLVVLAGIDRRAQTFVCVYSSEADRWSEPIYAGRRFIYIEKGNSVLIGSAIYFKGQNIRTHEPEILMYDLLRQEISLIHIPRVGILEHINHKNIVLMATEDGRLGVASMWKGSTTLFLWSRREHGGDEDARWALSRVIVLDTTLYKDLTRTHVVAFANAGTGGIIFIWSSGRLLSFDLKSGSSKVLGESFGLGFIVPYVTFCTPVLAAVSVEEGPGAGEPSAQATQL